MDPVLPFLPAILPYDGQWDPLRTAAHQCFEEDFFRDGIFDDGIRVLTTNVKGDDGFEKGFTHIVTRENDAGVRVPDIERARRIGWIRPLIENVGCGAEGYRHWRYLDGRAGVKRYYWAEQDNFVVAVLEGKKANGPWFLLSAFHIDTRSTVHDLESRYRRRLK